MTKINLRKLHAVLKQLDREVQINNHVQCELMDGAKLESIKASLKKASDDKMQEYNSVLALVSLRAKLRAAVQQMNLVVRPVSGTDVSITSLLNRKAELDAVLFVTSDYSGNAAQRSDEDTTARIVAQLRQNEKNTYGSDSINVRFFSTEHVQTLRDVNYNAKKELETVLDKLSVLNNILEVELQDDEVLILQNLRII